MTLEQERKETNALFTSSIVKCNGEKVVNYALEHTASMLPTGIYQVTLVMDAKIRKRHLAIVASDYVRTDANPFIMATYTSGNSYRDTLNKPNVVLGKHSIKGAVVLSRKVFGRLFERVEKCVARGERILLDITDHMMRQTEDPKFWLEDPKHGCPSSNRHVEVDDEGNVSVFDGETLIKVIPPSAH